MANAIYFTPNGDTEKTLFDDYVTDTAHFLHLEQGWENPDDDPMVEEVPVMYQNIPRDWTKLKDRIYTITMDCRADTPAALLTLRRTWNGYHNQTLGYGVLRRVTEDSLTRCLDCRPLKPQWEDVDERHRANVQRVVQRYLAAQPLWRDSSYTQTDSAFNGVTPVNKNVVNGGDVPCYWYADITGVINTPKLAWGSYEIEIETTTANADDVLRIDTRLESVGVVYYEHGAGAGDPDYVGYRTTASMFGPIGKGTVAFTLTAAAGTASISWYHRNKYLSL